MLFLLLQDILSLIPKIIHSEKPHKIYTFILLLTFLILRRYNELVNLRFYKSFLYICLILFSIQAKDFHPERKFHETLTFLCRSGRTHAYHLIRYGRQCLF